MSFVAVCGVAGLLASTTGMAEYVVVPVKNGGVIHGRVTFSGQVPPPVSLPAGHAAARHCGNKPRHLHHVRVKDGVLRDVVVYLTHVKQGKAFAAREKKATINQKKCTFQPYLTSMANGGSLEVVNSDPFLHNIHAFEMVGTGRRTVLNLSQPQKGNVFSKAITLKRGHVIRLTCDAHDFMLGFIFTGWNPYYERVNEQGEFQITEIPPGTYEIQAWHPFLGELSQVREIKPDGRVAINFVFH